MQPHPLLRTKLFVPPIRPGLVSRPRLLKLLNEGLAGQGEGFARKLTLISAPAGFGKTTLVSEWVQALGGDAPPRAVAWLSIDEGDGNSTRFLTYLVSALQTIAAGLGEGVLGMLQSPQSPPAEPVLTTLLNDITTIPEPFVLVLDDYHVVDAKPVDASTSVDGALTFLLEHLPPQMHLVIATREDPDLPLARLRARGQMSELRVSDLRFTPSEAAEFFNQVMDLNLSAEEVSALETRTEGWIAGLQLAALSMRGREDVSGFIRAFAGDNRYIVDYLVAEVLQLQSEAVRSFLLETSILDRLCGPLCDAVRFGKAEPPSSSEGTAVRMGPAEPPSSSEGTAVRMGPAEPPSSSDVRAVRMGMAAPPSGSEGTAVRMGPAEPPSSSEASVVRMGMAETHSGSEGTAVTGSQDSRGMLEALERGNLFVVPLDDKREWYRYHHLFAEVLRAHLTEEQPTRVSALHRRASEWYEDNGSPADAIRHALTAEGFERAAGLIELAWPAMNSSFQSATWLGWVEPLPDEMVRSRPVLSFAYAWALLDGGELEAGETRLRDAEWWLDPAADMGERWEAPSGPMIVVDEKQLRSLPASIATARALHAQALGDVPATVKHARRALDLLAESDYFERGRLAVLLGLAHWTSGDLEEAHETFSDAMIGFRMIGNILFAVSFTFILADIRIVQGRLREALSTYERSLQLAREQGEPALQGTAELYLGLSELHREQGDLEAARQFLLRSEELSDQTEVYRYRLCRARARIKDAQGDPDTALDLLGEAERWLHYENPLPDLRPSAALKARVWVGQGRLAQALGWVRERGLSVDDDLSYLREFEHMTLARVLIGRYKSDQVERHIHDALGLLGRLLTAAEAGGRTGSVIEILLLQALAYEAQGDIPSALVPLERALALAAPEGYVRIFVGEGQPMAVLLREALKHGIAPDYVRQLRSALGKAVDRTPVARLLIDPLSEREFEVLRLLRTELNGPEIARELVVSLNTMRTHTKNIYSKLGVNSRRAAVRRAEELDLF